MAQKNFTLTKIALPFAAAAAFLMTACGGDNPIEIENEKNGNLSWNYKIALDSVSQRLDESYYYRCYDNTQNFVANNIERCDTFIERFYKNSDSTLSLTTIINMVRDSINYNNKGSFIGENGDPQINYLLSNKMLKITLTSFRQTADSISSTKKIGDPEIRFLIKTYIDLEPSEYDPLSALVFEAESVKEWDGEQSVTIRLPRGIDGMDICPVLRDRNVHDAYYDDEDLLDESSCVSVENLGWVEEDKVKTQTTEGDKVTISWKWSLYAIDK